MTAEKKKDYTLRITQASQTQLLVILYEMLEDYLREAIEAGKRLSESYREDDHELMREGIRKARLCINQLMDTLNMDYELSGNLFRIYMYIIKELAAADVRQDTEPLTECLGLIGTLREGYQSIADQDKTGPVMENSQAVYTGLTYGRSAVAESSMDSGNRGFLV